MTNPHSKASSSPHFPDRQCIRKLAIYLWHHTDLATSKLSHLLKLNGMDEAEQFWKELQAHCILPEISTASDEGKAIEFEYGTKKTCILCPGDDDYPTNLYAISSAPIIGVKGNIHLLSQPQVAIVGSRQVCPSGQTLTPVIADDVMCRGFIVTSGGAAGIDALAHRQAMARNQATIVVSAMGTDKVYPKANTDIFDYARENGAIVSQFPNKVQTFKPNFPQRNDVIAALSTATVIVQCRQNSGALYTAKAAAKFHRPVFAAAMPGFDALTEGGLECIKTGMAKMLSDVHDFDPLLQPQQQTLLFNIFNNAQTQPRDPVPPAMLSATQNAIFSTLQRASMTREILRSTLNYPSDFDESMLELELSGLIQLFGGTYCIHSNS